jgi:hypothetical protein
MLALMRRKSRPTLLKMALALLERLALELLLQLDLETDLVKSADASHR